MNETSNRCGTRGPGRSPRAAARMVVFALTEAIKRARWLE
jgi:hypothetical protein